MGAKITGIGSYEPRTTVSNDFFRERGPGPAGGPGERRHAATDETSVFMGVQASRAAMHNAGREPDEIDQIICFSGMPDFEFPKDVNLIKHELGMNQAACLSVDTACASFISGLRLAHALILAGHQRRVLVLNVMSWISRGMDPAFNNSTLGDGAAAALVEAADEDSLIGAREKTESDYFDFITLRSPFASGRTETFQFSADPRFGRFFAKTALVPVQELLAETGVSPESIDWFIAHQTGLKLLEHWCKKLGLGPDRNLNTFMRHGNMSAVNIPMILDHYVNTETRVKRGDTILFFAPGAGLHVAAMLWRF